VPNESVALLEDVAQTRRLDEMPEKHASLLHLVATRIGFASRQADPLRVCRQSTSIEPATLEVNLLLKEVERSRNFKKL
jgi:hypothetical protein